MFRSALVRIPCRNLTQGISSEKRGLPDYNRAIRQHQKYVAALERCGLRVFVLPPDEGYPDSTFIEDTAVLTPRVAVICRPGVASRRGEEKKVYPVLKEFYSSIEFIEAPGTLEGGDVLQVGTRFYVGRSGRTNEEGLRQFSLILQKYGYCCIPVNLEKMLHLKTGVAYMGHDNLLVAGELRKNEIFAGFKRIEVDAEESYSANSLWINGKVLMPEGFAKTREKLKKAGYPVQEVDVSEFARLDGGLSCLSLRL